MKRSYVHGAKHKHGTNACYVLDRCGCDLCREAAVSYRRKCDRLKAAGKPLMVDAEPVRAHVNRLRETGMGWKRIALEAGVNPNCVCKLLYGIQDRGPSVRIHRRNAEKLLALKPRVTAGQLVDVLPVWEMIADLMELGYSRKWVAEALGNTGALQLKWDTCEALTFVRIKRLWDVYRFVPRKATNRQQAAAITRAENAARGIRRRVAAIKRGRARRAAA